MLVLVTPTAAFVNNTSSQYGDAVASFKFRCPIGNGEDHLMGNVRYFSSIYFGAPTLRCLLVYR